MPLSSTFEWEDLLLYIEDGRVVPVVGRELLVVELDGERTLLDHWLARRLAESLRVDSAGLPEGFGIDAVTHRYLEGRGRRQSIYARLRAIVEERPLPIPEPLRQLAEIRGLSLFVSTTFDELLVRALDEVRCGGDQRTLSMAWSPFTPLMDLGPTPPTPEQPAVMRIFGALSSMPDYAATDEDTLEFLHQLQSEAQQPPNLFDALAQSYLLFLGCGFPDWLARFFIRIVKHERFLNPRAVAELVVESRLRDEVALSSFLKLYQTEIFAEGDAVAFIAELHRRWLERQAARTPPPRERAPGPREPAPQLEDDAVFLSYAREDRDAVRRFRDAFDAAGIATWFDEREIQGGERWEREIHANLRRCALFVPFISEHTERRLDAWFRVEWHAAVQRLPRLDDSVVFLVPVVLGLDADAVAHVPDAFRDVHWTLAADAAPPQALVDTVRREIRRKRAQNVF
ncbi:MAG: toll/interleukin-1 receptor domain-containing protein [Deltaproteobacteria bacterium]|nr:toll/interleukin-1 receptor domain-containing protein [Deltaproteobacteria bacterium]